MVIDELAFDGGEEALGDDVFPTVTLSAHTFDRAEFLEGISLGPTSVDAPPVGMENSAIVART